MHNSTAIHYYIYNTTQHDGYQYSHSLLHLQHHTTRWIPVQSFTITSTTPHSTMDTSTTIHYFIYTAIQPHSMMPHCSHIMGWLWCLNSALSPILSTIWIWLVGLLRLFLFISVFLVVLATRNVCNANLQCKCTNVPMEMHLLVHGCTNTHCSMISGVLHK